MTTKLLTDLLAQDDFIDRHIGSQAEEISQMLDVIGEASIDDLLGKTVPSSIRLHTDLNIADATSEQNALLDLAQHARNNVVNTSYIGMGYYDTLVPPVIQRNVLENPGWYTAYTPYQPEISQGRLEALLNYQQMVTDLTGMDVANASLLDEATAAAEAMAMCRRNNRAKTNKFFIDQHVFPQTLEVLKTRAYYYDFELVIGDVYTELEEHEVFGVFVQYPNNQGDVNDLAGVIETVHSQKSLICVASDLMALVMLKAPGEMGADIVVGSAQRFGVPMGFGGPHAGFFAVRDKFKRGMPGRVIGVSVDAQGNSGYRMAMQTREQHIRREKATSNICTAQALLANMAGFYAVYHGVAGLTRIANRIHRLTTLVAHSLSQSGYKLLNQNWFDTLTVEVGDKYASIVKQALAAGINLRLVDKGILGLSIDEAKTPKDIETLLDVFGASTDLSTLDAQIVSNGVTGIPSEIVRDTAFLTHPVFNRYHCETEMLRYLKRLENKDLSLAHAMIPLGSCTMKLNATSQMMPVGWAEFSSIHPFAPKEQVQGYAAMITELENWLAEITGYDAVSMQPNSGAQGEYAGLVAINRYHASRGEGHRDVCLIPTSAHGTNPASAAMAHMKIVLIECDENGNIDLNDLTIKAEEHAHDLSCIMVTYPSTHGVFEEDIVKVCEVIHANGGQVYLDGANLNAQVGVSKPGQFGSDVSHLNLHKTFAIPHGGGGPGVGPIGVKSHLAPFLPSHHHSSDDEMTFAVSAAQQGSASILPVSWMYIKTLGKQGLKRATENAILHANYIVKRLEAYYPILYKGQNGYVAHECIVDIRPIKASSGITEEDIAKRLMDYGFHAPTMSFPVSGTLMIEPTESESKYEIDRFCDAMIAIKAEIEKVQAGAWPEDNNPLVNAPHTQVDISTTWNRPYSIDEALFPIGVSKTSKYWPTSNRIDNVYGDRNLVCSCPPIDAYR